MRCFIAVPVPDSERRVLISAANAYASVLSGRKVRVSWVTAEGLHLTFLFLGEIDADTAERTKGFLEKAAASTEPFTVGFSGIGQFPPRGGARVIHVPISRGADTCRVLHGAVADAMRDIADENDRRFVPHITLGRVKSGSVRTEEIESTARVEGAFRAERIALFRSHLRPQGAEYEELYSAVLGRK